MQMPRFMDAAEGADKPVRCSLCPRACLIQNGKFGACGIRGNKNGGALIPYYGQITALAMDPIEKKPLYHFRPGSSILSLGFSGCNLNCPFCQNWRISQNPDAPGRKMLPADIISLALREMPEKPAIAYTYSEPLVHAEFLLDCMALARRHGIANVLVSNGCVNTPVAREILVLTDAANIDLKCFSADSYAKILGGNLDTVLEFIRVAYKLGVHLEITTLVVPQFNDSADELDGIAQFIAGLDSGNKPGADRRRAEEHTPKTEIPWHLSAYHPDYRWNAPPTDPELLRETALRGRAILRYVYTGNIAGEDNDTLCPSCGAVLIKRRGYTVNAAGLAAPLPGEKYYRCGRCSQNTPVIASC